MDLVCFASSVACLDSAVTLAGLFTSIHNNQLASFSHLTMFTVVRRSEKPLTPASHEDPVSPGVLKRILLQRSDIIFGQVQMVNWSLMHPGKKFREHYHQDMQEIFIIVAGKCRMSARLSDGSSDSATLSAGDAIVIPPGLRHSMQNIGESTVEYIVFGVTTDQQGKTVVTEE